MSNTVILWGMLLIPISTLFFMNKEDIKRYTPVALFTAVTGAIISETGVTLGWWAPSKTVFFLNQIPIFTYTAIPIFTMWIFKFTYGNFWLYVATNALADIGFAYLILPWLDTRGISQFLAATSLTVYLINFVHQFLLYGYQMWQEKIFAINFERSVYPAALQPVAAKPLDGEKKKEKN